VTYRLRFGAFLEFITARDNPAIPANLTEFRSTWSTRLYLP
jgi:hypothetical protein